ncbi:helix-turn-helix domain-containing protein [Actinomadura syzygii]|uniref:Helix-turn-helix domain-containing protein n=1 Tax=Actinomadura syzygii TaxID=1427538 RepID=A0A5D0U5Q3_9ACTN|nr:ArsR family transcriptional regulator [Actinomadura syzygii]TYC13070.1 helix-turn-helix domain-containing protein [Actinomadura syzygii]
MVLPERDARGADGPPEFVRLAAHPLRWRLLAELAGGDHRVRELVARVGEPQNLVSYHLRLLRRGGLVTARRSSFDARDSYYHLDLDRCADALAATGSALHPALPGPAPHPAPPSSRRARVLFACTGNSARSPVAEALLRHHARGRVEVTSGGSRPAARVHPAAVELLRERYGIDIARQRPRGLDDLADRPFDHVITLCDRVREVCPEFGGRPRPAHWSIPDPAAAEDGDAFARTVTEIDTRVRHLVPVLAPGPDPEVHP